MAFCRGIPRPFISKSVSCFRVAFWCWGVPQLCKVQLPHLRDRAWRTRCWGTMQNRAVPSRTYPQTRQWRQASIPGSPLPCMGKKPWRLSWPVSRRLKGKGMSLGGLWWFPGVACCRIFTARGTKCTAGTASGLGAAQPALALLHHGSNPCGSTAVQYIFYILFRRDALCRDRSVLSTSGQGGSVIKEAQ